MADQKVATPDELLSSQESDKPTYRRSAFAVPPTPSREPDAARSLDTFRAVPPSFSQESVVARLRVDLATWVVDFLQCEPWEPVDELLLKLNGLTATAEVAIRELREVSGLDEDMGYSDRPGFPQ